MRITHPSLKFWGQPSQGVEAAFSWAGDVQLKVSTAGETAPPTRPQPLTVVVLWPSPGRWVEGLGTSSAVACEQSQGQGLCDAFPWVYLFHHSGASQGPRWGLQLIIVWWGFGQQPSAGWNLHEFSGRGSAWVWGLWESYTLCPPAPSCLGKCSGCQSCQRAEPLIWGPGQFLGAFQPVHGPISHPGPAAQLWDRTPRGQGVSCRILTCLGLMHMCLKRPLPCLPHRPEAQLLLQLPRMGWGQSRECVLTTGVPSCPEEKRPI